MRKVLIDLYFYIVLIEVMDFVINFLKKLKYLVFLQKQNFQFLFFGDQQVVVKFFYFQWLQLCFLGFAEKQQGVVGFFLRVVMYLVQMVQYQFCILMVMLYNFQFQCYWMKLLVRSLLYLCLCLLFGIYLVSFLL